MKRQGRARLLLGGMLALGWLVGGSAGSAQDYVVPSRGPVIEQTGFKKFGGRREPCCPPAVIHTVPPGTVIEPIPYDPKKVDEKKDGKDPIVPPIPAIDPAAPAPATDLSPSGTTSAQTIAPNLFGDRFGGSQAGLLRNGIAIANSPVPGAGGSVGRVKVSEVTNPLPRDRFIFTYDYFDDTPMRMGGEAGQTVNRYGFGVEKTFWDGMASVEARLPVASTLTNSFTNAAQGSQTLIGNLHLALRTLLYRDDTMAVGFGASFDLPTSPDTQLRDEFVDIRIRNQTVMIEPYFAVLFTPSERCFGQAWVSMPFAANDDRVNVNDRVTKKSFSPGSIQETTRLVLDGQIGYWVVRNDDDRSRLLRGLAPFVELHYTTSIENSDRVSFSASGGNYTLTELAGRTDEINFTAGVIMQIGDNCNLSVGSVLPLRTNDNQEFDFQIGVRANWFYGRTARDRSSAVQVGGF